MPRAKKGVSIQRKIFLAIVVISMVPTILFAVFSMSITYTTMQAQLVGSRTLSMDWLYDRLSLSVRSYTDQFYEYEVDKELKNSIVNWANGGQMDHIAQSRMRKSFETALSIDPDIRSIEVYSLSTGEGFISTRASFHSVAMESGKNVWSRRAPESQTNIVFDADGGDLLVMHQTNDFSTGRGAAIIILRIRMQAFFDILDKVKNDDRETAILLNDENKVLIASPGAENSVDIETVPGFLPRLRDSGQDGHQADKHLYFYETVSNGKLQIVYIVPNKLILQTLWQTTSIGIIILICAVFSAALLSFMFSRIISKPIVQLSKKMQTNSIWDAPDTVESERNDEIGFLQESFGIMVRRNQELIANELRNSQEKRDAQIRALQAQINPHFIYNTLQILGSMSLDGQTSDIYPVVVDLSDIMRYSFNFSREMVTLRDEIRYLDGYLSIQNHRFNNRVHIKAEIPDRLRDSYIPRLILQPVVENCFEHGLAEKPGEWHIGLTVRENAGEDMIITITDNGSGVPTQRLEELKAQLDMGGAGTIGSSDHIGLNNVNSRIKLRYGEGYGIDIDSEEGNGATVIIRTKLVWEAE